jgi:putative Mg2+ transporter-C (MgtC) family protein
MLTIDQMLIRFAVALILGAILGIERELVGKGTGVRTEMLVAGGSSLFAIVSVVLPFIAVARIGTTPDILAVTASFNVVANIIVGIGFLGAGLIVKDDGNRPHNLTTAALVWATAAIGILAGIGLLMFAGIVTVIIAILLFILRKLSIVEEFEHRPGKSLKP